MLRGASLLVKILALVAFNIAVMLVLASIAVVQMDRIGDELDQIAEIDMPLTEAVTNVTLLQLKQDTLAERAFGAGYRMAGDQLARDKFNDSVQRFDELEQEAAETFAQTEQVISRADQATSTVLQQKVSQLETKFTRIKAAHAGYEQAAGLLFVTLREGDREKASELLYELEDRQEKIDTDVEGLLREIETFTAESVSLVAEHERSAILLMLVVGAISLLITSAVGFGLARSLSGSVTGSAEQIKSVSQDMLGAGQQLSAASAETASAVTQTTSTLDELRQTAQTAADRASAVAEESQQSLGASHEAGRTLNESIEAMHHIRTEMESIAKNILELSEKNIRIGEIVKSVNGIAEQSNLLAVNASIEAAKAGEHGRGFSVVAAEVKTLAEQSKEATHQIERILAEIQKSSNGAVMVTEQGSKRVEEGSQLMEALRRSIVQLGETIEENSDSAQQISMTSRQQLAGVEQIATAMRNVEQATRDTAAGARQLEKSARQVDDVSSTLMNIVQGETRRA